MPSIWSTINHTDTKQEIAYAQNPENLIKEIENIKFNQLKNIDDSTIFKSDNVMKNMALSKDQKQAVFSVREKQNKYNEYKSSNFKLNEFVEGNNKTMLYKNISRPFLLIVFALIAFMVYIANKKKNKTI